MSFLLRNAIFVLFPLVVVAIVFLARISFGTAVSFGQWGERSIIESTLLVAREKIERIEQIISAIDGVYMPAVNPAELEEACPRWREASEKSSLVMCAAIIDDYGDVAAFFHNAESRERAVELELWVQRAVAPRLEKFESLDQYKHLHRKIDEDERHRLLTYRTTEFEDREYVSVIVYDTDAVIEELLAGHLGDVGENRVANVVDDRNTLIFGGRIDGAGEYIVARRFPSSFYKWRLQLAPRLAAMFESKAQAQRFSQVMLIPLALGVIALGLVVLYLAVVRERHLNRLQSEFIANVSHELKTPLSLIRMFSELLALGKVREANRVDRYHQVILRETDRLTSLIENVLNLSKIEGGKSTYNFKEAPPREILERIKELYEHRVEQAGVAFECRCEPGLPELIIDDHAVILALGNIIDNAIKYAEGTDVICLEVARKGRWVFFDVLDHGAGIATGHLRRIFDRFYRVPSAQTRKQRGSGIGLSIVKHIVSAHGGHVSVSSVPKVETRFSIRLPIGN